MARKFEKLTRSAMRSLNKGQRIVEHGIVYEKLKNGDARFAMCIMVNGKRMHRVVGKESEGITRKQAEDAIEKFKHEGREGRLSLPKGRKLPITFKEAAKSYMERLTIEDGKSLRVKKQQLNQRLIPFFGSTALEAMNSFQVE